MMLKIYNILLFISQIPFRDFLNLSKIGLILKVRPYTFLPYSKLSKLYRICAILEKEKIKGDFVECGVCNGGSAGIIAKVAENNSQRYVWLFDSWEGLPKPTEFDIDFLGNEGKEGMDKSSIENVKILLFRKLKLKTQKIHLVKGWFDKTIKTHKREIKKIALLHLDCDWYDSVKLCLEELYGDVVKEGFVVIDDYGHWKGCKKAVDEFIKKNYLQIELIRIKNTGGVYFRK